MRYSTWLAAAVLPAALVACEDDGTGPQPEAGVQVAFASAASPGTMADGELTLTGTNGTLVIEDVRMIVAEVELEGPEACAPADDDDEDQEECEFESGPFLLDLPLAQGNVVVATTSVPVGTYTRLEFEVEDLDEDEDDDFGSALAAIRQQMREAYPAFPDEASMVVRGTFTPVGGTAQAFTVYLDAEVEVEADLVPPLLVTDDLADTTITVAVNPAVWFTGEAGTVTDLSTFDGQRIEFEAEFEDGVAEVEWEEDD